ncbi:Hypothetical protein UVM_LOCUS464 [uncultured virus]|nr:Hypothetical protein UVM_LOCUS464 [uncultured virus]
MSQAADAVAARTTAAQRKRQQRRRKTSKKHGDGAVLEPPCSAHENENDADEGVLDAPEECEPMTTPPREMAPTPMAPKVSREELKRRVACKIREKRNGRVRESAASVDTSANDGDAGAVGSAIGGLSAQEQSALRRANIDLSALQDPEALATLMDPSAPRPEALDRLLNMTGISVDQFRQMTHAMFAKQSESPGALGDLTRHLQQQQQQQQQQEQTTTP